MKFFILNAFIIVFCGTATASESYLYFFPTKVTILGTGKKIYPIDTTKIRNFTVGDFVYPIDRTKSISDKDHSFVLQMLSKNNKLYSLNKIKSDLSTVFMGGVIEETNGRKRYFLLTSSKIIEIISDNQFNVASNYKIEKWITKLRVHQIAGNK